MRRHVFAPRPSCAILSVRAPKIERMFGLSDHSRHRGYRIWQRHVLPDAHHSPPRISQGGRDKQISIHISPQFRRPIPLVARRLPSMLRTDMPEASVDKDSDLACSENDVWPNSDTLLQHKCQVLAIPVAKPMQLLAKGHFRLGIRPPIGSHVARPAFIRRCGIEPLRMGLLASFTPIIARDSHATAPNPVS
jgi:hypothetical protein